MEREKRGEEGRKEGKADRERMFLGGRRTDGYLKEKRRARERGMMLWIYPKQTAKSLEGKGRGERSHNGVNAYRASESEGDGGRSAGPRRYVGRGQIVFRPARERTSERALVAHTHSVTQTNGRARERER